MPKTELNMVITLTDPVEDQPSEFKVLGYEMLEREVKQSGNTGRVYLPKSWVGTRVKIMRVSQLERKEHKK